MLSHESEQQQKEPTAAASVNASKIGRQGSRKVRTGCSTCKVRRVKCDEGKPACQRCISTGRTCHGYQGFGDGKTMSRREILSYQGSLLAKLRDLPEFESSDEGNLFEFFFHVTAPSLALDLDSEFWRSIMPQFCHTEEPLRHAALALGGFHKAFLDGQGQLSDITPSAPLEQYLKAIRSLRGRLQTASSHDLTSMLLTTLLFVCIEYIQGNEVNALSYLQQGRQLMQHWTCVRRAAEYDVGLLRQTIVPLYQRSSFTMCMFGACLLPIPDDMVTYHSVPATFSSLDEARQVFYSVSDTVWHFISNTSCIRYGELPSAEEFALMHDRREALLQDLSQWHIAFSLFMASGDSPKTLNPSALVMRLHYHAATIWLSASMSVGEACYDSYVDTFSTILCLGRTYLRTMKCFTNRPSGYDLAREGFLGGDSGDAEPQHKPSHSFIFDTHVIPILYFTAVKCRHPLLRKTALGLMEELTSTRENLWQGNIAVCVAKRLIDIETASSEDYRNGARGASMYGQRESGSSTSLGHASCLGHNFSDLHKRNLTVQPLSQFEPEDGFRSDVVAGGPSSENIVVDPERKISVDGMVEELLAKSPLVYDDDVMASRFEETKLASRSLETEDCPKPVGGPVPAAFLRPPFGVPEYVRVTDAVLEPSKNTLRRIKIVRKLPGSIDQWEIWEEWIETSINKTGQL